ncbi:hypothetical protein IWQ62_004046 [Dispira parvispora]|uniref:Uncharacterized protein n=1 Tax=Dispira parvispora TaxID=1520584 RepID=A0A9W8E121_9FUNG|nr:hypothetical protein IWQ62_004046 [Dispira parvispora]
MKDLCQVHINAHQAVETAKVLEWRKTSDVNLDRVIQQLERLKSYTDAIANLDKEIENLHSGLIYNEWPQQRRNWEKTALRVERQQLCDAYHKQKKDALSMFPVDSQQKYILLDRSYDDNTWVYSDSLKGDLDRKIERLNSIKFILEGANLNSLADPITWVPLSDLDDPLQCVLFFPLLYIRREATDAIGMSEYNDLVGGSLRLKGKGLGIKKKKSKKHKSRTKPRDTLSSSKTHSPSDTAGDPSYTTSNEPASSTGPAVTKTEAERKFEEVQQKRKMDRIQSLANKSHRERVAELNEYLETLSEHYDIPKVGPG